MNGMPYNQEIMICAGAQNSGRSPCSVGHQNVHKCQWWWEYNEQQTAVA